MIDMKTLRANGNKTVTIKEKGQLTIGDDEFPYPIVTDSVSVRREGVHNLMTMTIVVGEVHMEKRSPRQICPNCDCHVYGVPTNTCPSCDAEMPCATPTKEG